MEMEYSQLYNVVRDNEANGQENLYHQISYVMAGNEKWQLKIPPSPGLRA